MSNDYKKLFDDEKSWHKKIAIVAACHLQHRIGNKRWTLVKTAKLLDLSVGTVSEDCRIAEMIDRNPKLIDRCSTRKDALKYIYK